MGDSDSQKWATTRRSGADGTTAPGPTRGAAYDGVYVASVHEGTSFGVDIEASAGQLDLGVDGIVITVRDVNRENSYRIGGDELLAKIFGRPLAPSAPHGYPDRPPPPGSARTNPTPDAPATPPTTVGRSNPTGTHRWSVPPPR